jgi:hypothetical protein
MAGTGALDAIIAKLGDVRAASASTAAQVTADAAVVAEQSERMATRADDVRHRMAQLGEQGNAWAGQLAGIIAQFEEGMLQDRLAVINSMGDGLAVVDGQLRSVRDLLDAVLPSAGEVQARIREMVEQLKADGVTIEELTARLAKQSNSYARELAEMLRLAQQGKLTLQELARRAQEVAEQFPGSETGALAELLMEGIRDGSIG